MSQLIGVIVDFSACHAEGRGFEPRRSRQYHLDHFDAFDLQLGPLRPIPTFWAVAFQLFGPTSFSLR